MHTTNSRSFFLLRTLLIVVEGVARVDSSATEEFTGFGGESKMYVLRKKSLHGEI